MKNKKDRDGQSRSTEKTSVGQRRLLQFITRATLRQIAKRGGVKCTAYPFA